MKFRPCIDIHNGKVKQIVGGTLADKSDYAEDNFVSEYGADFYANLYKKHALSGGHIILLNPHTSDFHKANLQEAYSALDSFRGGLQIGGGVTAENAKSFIDAGASHVIVTSYAFKDGKINFANIDNLVQKITAKKLVLDLSCRKKDGEYFIVTDRWQNFSSVKLNNQSLDMLAKYCDEFLIHAVDVEGKISGIEDELAEILGNWGKIPMTYAGGISSTADLDKLSLLGNNKLDFTVGSALDIFGGKLKFETVAEYNKI